MAFQGELSPSQRTAIEHPWEHTIQMVLSTAGSGKTLVLTLRAVRIAQHLVAEKAHGSRVLCICYNRSAADEMADRITASLKIKALSDVIFVSRDATTMPLSVTIEVRTFHSLGLYVLTSTPVCERHLVGLDARHLTVLNGRNLRTKYRQALQRAGFLPNSDNDTQNNRKVSKLLRQLADMKGRVFERLCATLLETGRFEAEQFLQTPEFSVYEDMLSENNAIDYSDMLRKTVTLLYHSSTVWNRLRKRYRTFLVDEFQDMSPSQMFLCRALADESKSATLVGDDDQQIYSFRTGLDWCCHDVIGTTFSNIDIVTLEENHRCPGAVVKAAYAVITNNGNRIPKDFKAVRGDGHPVHVVACKNVAVEMDFVVKRIKALLPIVRAKGDRILLLFRRNGTLQDFRKRLGREKIVTTRRATQLPTEKCIGSFALRVYALLAIMTPRLQAKAAFWAVMTLSPCTDEHFLRSLLDESSATGLDRSLQTGDCLSETPPVCQPLQSSLSPLEKIRAWYQMATESHNSSNAYLVDGIHDLLSVVDALALKAKNASRLEDVVNDAKHLLIPGSEVSEALVSSQNAIDYEPDYDKDKPAIDCKEQSHEEDALKVITSIARMLDTNEAQRTSFPEKGLSFRRATSENEPRNDDDDDDDDFAELFCRDRRSATIKRRRLEGIDRISRTQIGVPMSATVFRRQLDLLCSMVGKRFRSFDSKYLARPSGDASVVLLTAHGAKGSTFPYVFLCGADNDSFPVGGRTTICANPYASLWNSSQSSQGLEDARLQEERRLFFVALTRTTTQFICTYSSQGIGASLQDSQSPFIREMLQGLQWDPKYVIQYFVATSSDLLRLAPVHHKIGSSLAGAVKLEP